MMVVVSRRSSSERLNSMYTSMYTPAPSTNWVNGTGFLYGASTAGRFNRRIACVDVIVDVLNSLRWEGSVISEWNIPQKWLLFAKHQLLAAPAKELSRCAAVNFMTLTLFNVSVPAWQLERLKLFHTCQPVIAFWAQSPLLFSSSSLGLRRTFSMSTIS